MKKKESKRQGSNIKNPHITHCNQGEYKDMCKYGEDDCPMLSNERRGKMKNILFAIHRLLACIVMVQGVHSADLCDQVNRLLEKIYEI